MTNASSSPAPCQSQDSSTTDATATLPKTIGVDLGDRYSQVTVLAPDGRVLRRCRLKTQKEHFARFFREHRGARVAYEVGSHSLWVTWLLESIGCETVVANPRAIPVITRSHKKNDVRDADLLAEFAQVRPKLLEPIKHRGPEGYAGRALLNGRDALVRSRTGLINTVRGTLKAIGVRVTKGTARTFHKHAAEAVPAELREALLPLLEEIGSLTGKINDYERKIAKLIDDAYPEAHYLQQVDGVGPLTSLSFILAVEDPNRFKRSRDVGPYLGLVPKQRQSGSYDPELRISKAGDRVVRSLLVQCAQYILGRFGPDCDLRRFGERLAARGAKAAKRRAVVAVARKLAVLLHALWVNQSDYEPLRNAARAAS